MQENQEDGELSNTFLVHKILQLMRNFTIMLLNFFYVTDDGFFFSTWFEANESFEKLASMSLIANITVYLTTRYNLSGIFVVNVVNIWNGSSNVASLAGAFVSDAYLGRFRTLILGSTSSILVINIHLSLPFLMTCSNSGLIYLTASIFWNINKF